MYIKKHKGDYIKSSSLRHLHDHIILLWGDFGPIKLVLLKCLYQVSGHVYVCLMVIDLVSVSMILRLNVGTVPTVRYFWDSIYYGFIYEMLSFLKMIVYSTNRVV